MKLETLETCNLCQSSQIDTVDSKNLICRCRDCGYVFDNPRPSLEEIRLFYSNEGQYEGWIEEERAREDLWKTRLKKLRKVRPTGSLLDVGSGIGQFLHFAKAHFEVDGTEVSESAIKIARDKYGLNLRQGTLEEIDFGQKRYDVITLFHVLEHVPYPSALVDKCIRLLKDRGVLVIAVPNDLNDFLSPARGIKKKLKRLFVRGYSGFRKIRLDQGPAEIHLSHFPVPTLKRWLQTKNLRIVEDSIDPYYVAAGLKKIKKDFVYRVYSALKLLTGCNLYKATWIIAEKRKAP